MTPISQELEPPANPERFSHLDLRIFVGREVVEYDNLSRSQRRHEDLFDEDSARG
jgi:hypothetical protein